LFSQINLNNGTEQHSILKHQHTIDIEPLNIAYSYAQKTSKQGAIGLSVHFGFGLRLYLNTPKYLAESNCTDTVCPSHYHESTIKFLSPALEAFKVQLLYRRFIAPNSYLDIGGYFSKSSLGGFPNFLMIDSNLPNEKNIGATISIFYGFKRIKLGHRIQFGRIHRNYSDGVETKITSLLLTPLVLQLSFID